MSPAPVAWGQVAEEVLPSFFDPIVTRNPTLERELEVAVEHEKGREGRRTTTSLELSWTALSRLQFGLEVPLVIADPKGKPSETGLGDVILNARVAAWSSLEHRAIVVAGVELTLPTGSESRGLGGETSIQPFVTGGVAVGPVDLIGEVGYQWTVGGDDSGAEQFLANLAAGYVAWKRLTPSLELNLVHQTRGSGELVGRTQVYLTPGLGVALPKGTSVRAGVQLPLTSARPFDYRVVAAFNWEF